MPKRRIQRSSFVARCKRVEGFPPEVTYCILSEAAEGDLRGELQGGTGEKAANSSYPFHVPVQLDAQTRIVPGLIVQVGSGTFKQCNPVNYDFFTGPPNFVFDVFRDGQREEYKRRRECFERAGVLEYVAWHNADKLPEWHQLIDGRFRKAKPDKEGLIRSTALPGLWIPVDALKSRDWWAVMATISRGITRHGHRDFMATIWKD